MTLSKYVYLSSTLLMLALGGCDAMNNAESPVKSAAEQNLKPAKTYHYKETVQVVRELLSYGGKYTCKEELVEPEAKEKISKKSAKKSGKKSKTKVVADERMRSISVERGYFRSLIERPCYFKGEVTELEPVRYKAQKRGGTTIGTPLVVCPNPEALKSASAYDDASSGCKRVSGALVSFEAWE